MDKTIATDSHPEGRGPTGYAALWRNRDFLLLWSGQAVSSFGSQISGLSFPLLILALTGSPAQAGFVGALRALPFAVLSLPAGALIDRWDRRRTMIWCDLGRIVALASVPLALAYGRLGLLQLAVVSLIEGSLFLFFNLAESSCLPRVVTEGQLSSALAQNGLTDSLAQLMGPSLGGALYGLGRAIPFALDALSYAISLVSLFFVRTPLQEERAAETGRLRDEMVEGIRWLWRQGILRLVALATGGLMVCSVGYQLIMIVLGERVGATPFELGLIFAGGGAGSIVGGLITPWLQRRCRFGPLLIGAAWVWAITWLFFLFAPNVPALVVANAASFVVVPVYMITQYRYRLSATPDRLQGRTNAIFRLIVWGSQPLGVALAGLLLERLGPDSTIWILFVPQILIALAITGHAGLRRAGWTEVSSPYSGPTPPSPAPDDR